MLFACLSTLTGAYLLICLRGGFLLHPVKGVRFTLDALKTGSHPGRTLLLALAGTLGVGNIGGIAFSLLVGGAGSIFWMWVSAVFAATLKFTESVLSVRSGGEGMLGVLRSFGKTGRIFSYMYAGICLVTAGCMGAALQSRTAADCLYETVCLPPWITVVTMALFVFIVITRGHAAINQAVAWTVPAASFLYAFLCLFVILRHIETLPHAFSLIWKGAFYSDAAVGGIGGFLLSRAVRMGYAGGLLSNEAGAGTSAFAHTSEHEKTPVAEGMMGVCEIIFDTVILCSLTALMLLTGTGGDLPDTADGMAFVLSVLSSEFGPPVRWFLSAAILLFAFATEICWYYYGETCAVALHVSAKVYLAYYTASCLFGAFCTTAQIIPITDTCLYLLSSIVLPCLALSAKTVKVEMREASLPSSHPGTERKKRRRGRQVATSSSVWR